MAKVELKNVSKIYDKDVRAVKSANLVIEDKEFVVLVGPSGCGKSTLLRMVAGLEEISEGELWIGDRMVNEVAPKNRDIAMVFQNYALYPHMSVFDNMAFGLKLRKFPQQEIEQRVNEAGDILGLKELLHRKPKALSGGQRQRVALGRAIVRKPEVFLFDEPLSNLDAKLRVQMRIEISRLHHRLQSTMIYVTHDQVEAMTMGSKIVVLKDGIIQQVDSPLNLYNNPKNLFVAGFIGSPAMNFLRGQLVRQERLQFHARDIQVDLPERITKVLDSGKHDKVILGVRPENIHPVSAGDAQIAVHDITVDVVEPIGNETFVYFRSAGENICMRTAPEAHYHPSSSLKVGFDPDRVYLFDAKTEERLV